MPAPWLGVQVSPSLSVKDIKLVAPASCDEKVRPVRLSVNSIGSRLVTCVGTLFSSQVARAGDEASSNPIRSVCVYETKNTFPVFQLTPIEGSPASVPIPAGGM